MNFSLLLHLSRSPSSLPPSPPPAPLTFVTVFLVMNVPFAVPAPPLFLAPAAAPPPPFPAPPARAGAYPRQSNPTACAEFMGSGLKLDHFGCYA